LKAILLALLLHAGVALAQDCPAIDAAEQKQKEAVCSVTGGQWARWGVRDHLCNIYSCVQRTRDAGKPCRNRSECEHVCMTKSATRIGEEVVGECSPLMTNFGCHTHVDGGRIVGRLCVD
jgi:hypothetical protein